MATARTATLVKKEGVSTCTPSLESIIALLGNGEYTVTIKKKTSPRTLNQNALMWMWFQCIEDETGNDRQDIHDWYCNKFLQRTVKLNGAEVRVAGTTSTLDTEQMTQFLTKVQVHAAQELGISLPLPADKHYEAFYATYKH